MEEKEIQKASANQAAAKEASAYAAVRAVLSKLDGFLTLTE